jgi:hypothetical protein
MAKNMTRQSMYTLKFPLLNDTYNTQRPKASTATAASVSKSCCNKRGGAICRNGKCKIGLKKEKKIPLIKLATRQHSVERLSRFAVRANFPCTKKRASL